MSGRSSDSAGMEEQRSFQSGGGCFGFCPLLVSRVEPVIGAKHEQMKKRHLRDITRQELKEVCLLSGETCHDFKMTVTKDKDEDENVRFIHALCVTTHEDKIQSKSTISINVGGLVYVRHHWSNQKPCSNVCDRDCIIGQVAVLHYLLLKGFVFGDDMKSAQLMASQGAKAWLKDYKAKHNPF